MSGRRGRLPVFLLAAMALSGLAAPWLSPHPPDRIEDVAGGAYLPPLTRAHVVPEGAHRFRIVTDLQQDGSALRAGRPVRLTPEQVARAQPRLYLLGTDALGRDLSSRVLFGLRYTLLVAVASVALALVLGILVGVAAGLGGAWSDFVLMRFVELFQAVPRLLLVLLCAALFGPSFLLLVLVMGATTWPTLARLVRVRVRALREGEIVLAARAGGAAPVRVLIRHLLPQLAPLLAVTAALRLADSVLLESALSFLGMGAPPPEPSLGRMIAAGRAGLARSWWVPFWPGLLISILVLASRSTVARAFRKAEPPSVV